MATIATACITSRRLHAQRLAGPLTQRVEEAVRHLVGVQAQDYGWAKWSIGLRLCDATEHRVERAIAHGEIVRTWLMRGTLHFVSEADVGWLTALLAPEIIARNRRRYQQLELDDRSFGRSNDVLREVLAGGQLRIRSQIARALEATGISTEGQRAPYLLQRAALDGLICLGPPHGREPTYRLQAKSAPTILTLERDEALGTLAMRYFTAYGPATVVDFAWWSGLPMSDARGALVVNQDSLARVLVDGKELWAGNDWEPSAEKPGACLLPPFDSYLLGYRDRAAVLDPAYAREINAGGGMPRPAVLIDGKVAGVWKRTTGRDSIEVRAQLFYPLDSQKVAALEEAAQRLGRFYEMPIRIVP
jgi:hypothetical protein